MSKTFDVSNIKDLVEDFKNEKEKYETIENNIVADFGIEVYRQMDSAILNETNEIRMKAGYSIYIDEKQLVKDVEDLRKYRALEQELGCSIESIMAMILVLKNKKYYFKLGDKIHECDDTCVNNIYWNKATNEALISVSTNNKELIKEHGAYDVMLFANDYGKIWALRREDLK